MNSYDCFLGLTSNGWIAIATMVIAIATITAAILAVINNKRLFILRTKNEWLRTYKEHYRDFWSDDDLKKVRLWIVNNEAYKKNLLPVLQKRLNENVELSEEDYLKIDVIDKFINMVMLIRQINPKLSNDDEVWEELMLSYWQASPMRSKRLELQNYIKECYEKTFYKDMKEVWNKSM